MRALTPLLILATAAQGLLPAGVAAAQSGDDRYAADACRAAVQGEVRSQYPQAYGIVLTTQVPNPISRNETQVTGRGEFQDRNGGAARFNYGCTYNARSGATYALGVRDVRPIAQAGAKKDNSAAIAGLVLGAIVVGAALAASDKDKDRARDYDRNRDFDRDRNYDRGRDYERNRDRRDEWYPEAGVRCVAREAACYQDGRYSDRWTRRIFVR
jgi:hypothetical protein